MYKVPSILLILPVGNEKDLCNKYDALEYNKNIGIYGYVHDANDIEKEIPEELLQYSIKKLYIDDDEANKLQNKVRSLKKLTVEYLGQTTKSWFCSEKDYKQLYNF